MRRGRQAADDGSFARSVGVHTARGALLIGIAVLLGLILLQKVDTGKGSSSRLRAATDETVATTTSIPRATTTTRPPSAVKVLVANGTKTDGMGGSAQRLVAQAGYNALAAVSATPAAIAAQRQTMVYYAAGYDTEARKVGQLLGLGANLPPISPMPASLPVSDLKGANVLLVVGPDYVTKVRGTPTTVGPTTTTTRTFTQSTNGN